MLKIKLFYHSRMAGYYMGKNDKKYYYHLRMFDKLNKTDERASQ